MKISVIGGGYVGLVTAACFAEIGHDVTIIELDPRKVDQINSAIPPIYEEGLEEILRNHIGVNLRATSSYEVIAGSDASFICVGTPPADDGSANLHYLKAASRSVGESLKSNPGYHVVVVKSTVPPGTTEKIVIPAVTSASGSENNRVGFCMNPEFLREGRAVEDFMHPDRIVIGAGDNRAEEILKRVYDSISAPFIYTSLTAAEMIKYTANAFLATKISFSNEIGNVCKRLGIDVYDVMEGVGLDHRIGPLFLNAGIGFGGSCFPKDVMALIHMASDIGENPVILKSVIEVNEQQPGKIVDLLIQRTGDIKGKRIAILGLAFKDNTDDIRDSRAIPVIDYLLSKDAHIAAYDPMAIEPMRRIFPEIEYCNIAINALRNADACLVLTEWPEFSSLSDEFNEMKTRIIIEGRHILTIDDKEGVCW